jgi:hypothetical protein
MVIWIENSAAVQPITDSDITAAVGRNILIICDSQATNSIAG